MKETHYSQRLLWLMVLTLSFLPSFAISFDYEGIFYNVISENTVEVTASDNYSGDIVIPDSVYYDNKAYAVTNIGRMAFHNCTELTSVILPSTVTTIDYSAFSICIHLKSVNIPNSTDYIANDAFKYCFSLTTIEIPKSVTNIGDGALSGCINLKGISVDSENPNYTSVDGILFSKNKNLLHTYPAGHSGENYTIPDCVSTINMWCFSNCSNLTNIEIPNSVSTIDYYAFASCTGLTSIEIPNSVISIGEGAFADCSGLTYVYLGKSLAEIGGSAFIRDLNITDIYSYNSYAPVFTLTPAFSQETYTKAQLHVLPEALDRYKSAKEWSNFVNIIGDLDTNGIDDSSESASIKVVGGEIINAGRAFIKVYSMSGVEVYRGYDERVSHLTPGIYFVVGDDASQKVLLR